MDSLVGWNDELEALVIEKPAAGEQITVSPGVDQGIDISAIATLEAQFYQTGSNLWVVFEDGAIIIVEGYFEGGTEEIEGTPRSIVVDGETFTGEEFLEAFSIEDLPAEFAEGETGESDQQQNGVSFDDPDAGNLGPDGANGIGLLNNTGLQTGGPEGAGTLNNFADTEPTIGEIEPGQIDESLSDDADDDGVLDPELTATGFLAVNFNANAEDAGADGEFQDAPTGPNSGNRSIIFTNNEVNTTPSLLPAGLESGGVELQYILSEGDTVLTAYAGPVDPANVVFQVKLFDDDNGDGTAGRYEFTLFKPLDHPEDGTDTLSLSFNFTANDSDNDSSSAEFTVDVVDDVPTSDGEITRVINEDDIVTFNSVGSSPHWINAADPVDDGDNSFTAFPWFGIPADAIGPAVSVGSLEDVADFGSDGLAEFEPYAFQSDPVGTMDGLGLLSRGDNVVFEQVSLPGDWTGLLGYVDRGGETGFDLVIDRPVIGFALNTQTGDFAVLQFDQLDHEDDGNNDENTNLVVDTQINDQVDGILASIDFGAVIEITDGDGDVHSLAGDLLVTVRDDVPQILNASASGTVAIDESFDFDGNGPDKDNLQPDSLLGLAVPVIFTLVQPRAFDPDIDDAYGLLDLSPLSRDVYAWGNVLSFDPFSGADDAGIPGLPGIGDVDVDLEIVGGDGTSSGLFTTAGSEILLYETTILGETFVVGRFDTFLGEFTAFAIYIDDFGNVSVMQSASLRHSDDQNLDDVLDLSGKINAVISITDEDGDTISTDPIAIGANIEFYDDGPIVTGSENRSVDEDDIGTLGDSIPGRNEGSDGTDSNDGSKGPVTITGNLSDIVDFGADGRGSGDEFSFVSESVLRTALEDLGLTSKDVNLRYDVDSVSRLFFADSQILYGFVDRGDNDNSFRDFGSNSNQDRLIFSLELFENGSYEYIQYDQLDHVDGDGENTALRNTNGGTNEFIDFGQVIEVTDGDGDTITLGEDVFTVTVTDDVPVIQTSYDGRTVRIDESAGSQNDDTTSFSIRNLFSGLGLGPAIAYATDDVVDTDEETGADEPISDVSYDLIVRPGADSGVETTIGEKIYLYTSGDLVVGSTSDTGIGASDKIAFAIHISDSGNVSVAQYKSLKHGDATDPDDDLTIVGINPNDGGVLFARASITDEDGDTVFDQIEIGSRIAFDDDGPDADNDQDSVAEGASGPSIASGNVLDNDDAGTDGNASISRFQHAGTTYDTSAGTSEFNDTTEEWTLTTAEGGTFTLKTNGEFTYTPAASLDHSATEQTFLIDADFESGVDGFQYQDDLFGPQGSGSEARGYRDNSGNNDGSEVLRVDLGYNSNQEGDNLSGGFQRGFTLAEATTVTLSFDFRIFLSGNTETDEFIQALFSIDGGPSTEVGRLTGNAGSSDQVQDYQNFTVEIELEAGSHTLEIGAFLNKTTEDDERGNVRFDNVELSFESVLPVTEEFTYTMVDGDLDEDTATLTIDVTDTGPTVSVSAIDTLVTDETPGIQASTDEDVARTAGLTALYLALGSPAVVSTAVEDLADITVTPGGDAIASTVVSLTRDNGEAFTGQDSGLDDAQTNADILLFTETFGGTDIVVGRVGGSGGQVAFALDVNTDGDIALAQFRSVEHLEDDEPNDEVNLDLVHVTATTTDSDGSTDTDTSDDAVTITFRDDAPSNPSGIDVGNAVEVDQGETVAIPVALSLGDFGADAPATLSDATVEFINAVGGTPSYSNGVISFTADQQHSGAASFEYRIVDTDGDSSQPATVNLDVQEVNQPPVAVNDIIIKNFGSNAFNVPEWAFLLNDSDADSDPLNLTQVGNVSGLTSVNHTGDPGADTPGTPGLVGVQGNSGSSSSGNGLDGSFDYTISDSTSTHTATVTVNQDRNNVRGTNANEIIVGNGGSNEFEGRGGRDAYFTGGGNDDIFGDEDDYIFDGQGGDEDTLILGANFNDRDDNQIRNIEKIAIDIDGGSRAVDVSDQTEGFSFELDGSVTNRQTTVTVRANGASDSFIYRHGSISPNHNNVAVINNFDVANDKIEIRVNGSNETNGSFTTVSTSNVNLGSNFEVIAILNRIAPNLADDGNGADVEGDIGARIGGMGSGTYTFIVYSSFGTAADAGLYSVFVPSNEGNLDPSEFTTEHIMTLTGVGYNSLTATNFDNVSDPIILDLDGDGAETIAGPVAFDMDADGIADQIGWVGADDGLLVVDGDKSGAIEDGSEVFSEVFEGGSYANSLEALRSLDSNADGKIDETDDRFAEIKVWQDADSDGETDEGELKTLDEHGIVSLDLIANDADTRDNGNLIFAEGEFTKSDGNTGSYVGVVFGSKASEPDAPGPDDLVIAKDGVTDAIIIDDLSSAKIVEGFNQSEDSLDLSALLDGVAEVTATTDGTDTTIAVDPDGEGGPEGAHEVAILSGVSGGVIDLGADQVAVEMSVATS